MNDMNLVFSGRTILVAEDDDGLRDILVEELEMHGAKVFSAANGRDAFDITTTQHVDGIVSDIRMPGGDGIELLTRVREHNFAVPGLIFVTGFSDLTVAEAYNLGAEAILPKPFDLDVLATTVARLLTPKIIRWTNPFKESDIKYLIEKNYTSLEAAIQSGELQLGRGGAFIRSNESNLETIPENAIVKMRLEFKTGPILLIEGCVNLKWLSEDVEANLGAGYGVEFEHLTKEASEQLNIWIEHLKLKPYIPKN